MKIRSFIRHHFEAALQHGWLQHFEDAAKVYGHPVAMLMALASRETNMQNIRGDFRGGEYHGYGVMQVDIGTAPEWCKSGKWRDPREAIRKGAEILKEKSNELQRAGKEYDLSRDSFLWILAASYNHGVHGSLLDFVKSDNPDLHTTGHDYGRDVIDRMKDFEQLLKEHAQSGRIESNMMAGIDEAGKAPEVPTEATPAPVLAAVEGGAKDDPPKEIEPAEPKKSGAFKAMIATIATGLTAIGVDIMTIFRHINDALADRPALWIGMLIITAAIVLCYWKFMDRQTKLDLAREDHAHDLDKLHATIAADPTKINVQVVPPQN